MEILHKTLNQLLWEANDLDKKIRLKADSNKAITIQDFKEVVERRIKDINQLMEETKEPERSYIRALSEMKKLNLIYLQILRYKGY